MSLLCFDASIKCRFSLLSFYVLSYTGGLNPRPIGQSRVKHSTTEPLRSHGMVEVQLSGFGFIKYEVRGIFSGYKAIAEDNKDKDRIKNTCRINFRP